MIRAIRSFSLALALLSLTACGEVVTPQPTITPSPSDTPSAAPTSASRLTATPPLTPPPATAAPADTATPVVHIVQQGETLLSIAFDYGVSLQTLQAVNGIDNPQLLQVGQQLVIPTGQEEPGTTVGLLLPTPTPLPFEVRGVALYETPVGSLWCLGEIANTTAFTLTNVQVHVTLFDAAGGSLAEADAFAAADLIPPGERSPFGILFTDPPPGWANHQVAVLRGESAAALAASYVPIGVSDLEGQPTDSQLQVSGVVRNDSADQTAGSVSVIVTTYNGDGVVTGFRQAAVEVEAGLPPGGTAPFTLLFTFHGDAPTDFHVVALGRVLTE